MKQKLDILLIEDIEDDAMLILRELRKGGFEPSYLRVESEEETRKVLKQQRWDVILSDHNLPMFNALSALALIKELKLDTPFIIVSGSMSVQMADIAIRAGASGFILKSELSRLPDLIRKLIEKK